LNLNVDYAGFFTADGEIPANACVAGVCQACKDSLRAEGFLSGYA
jgi:hypothetical protein